MVVGRCIDDSGLVRRYASDKRFFQIWSERATVSVLLWPCGRRFSSWADVVGISAAISAFICIPRFLEDGRLMMRGLPKVGGEVASGVDGCGKGYGRRPDEARELSGKRETRR